MIAGVQAAEAGRSRALGVRAPTHHALYEPRRSACGAGDYPIGGPALACVRDEVAAGRSLDGGDAEKTPPVRHALEVVLAAVGERDPRADDEVLDRARDEYLIRARER